eukprot:TRINITY_DN15279_c0_g2_i1.p1 TRINITY_DN15279_c0_g2~~TRINITY_DN15279_c0_g2_i1.p1  ORF type:complete len:1143 (+),score=216.69 TRINITY_DN15279_c0_g2_i1:55-3429(+)
MPVSWRDWWEPPNPHTAAGALRVRQYVEWVAGLGALSEQYEVRDAAALADPEVLGAVVRFLVPTVELPRQQHACHGPRLSSDGTEPLSAEQMFLEDAIMAIWEQGGAPPSQDPAANYSVADIHAKKPDALAKLLHGIFKAFLLSELVPQAMDMLLWYNQVLRPYHKQLSRTGEVLLKSAFADVSTADVLSALTSELLDCSAWICCFHAHCQPAYMLDLGTVYWAPNKARSEQLLANTGFCFSMFEAYEIQALYSLKGYVQHPHAEFVALQAYVIWKVLRTYPSLSDVSVRALNFRDQSSLLRAARMAEAAAENEAEDTQSPYGTPPRLSRPQHRAPSASPHSGYVDALRVGKELHGIIAPASPPDHLPTPLLPEEPAMLSPLPGHDGKNLAQMLKVMIQTHKSTLLSRSGISRETKGVVNKVADMKWMPKQKPPRVTYPVVDDREFAEAEKQRIKEIIAQKKKPRVPRFPHGPPSTPVDTGRPEPPPRKPRPPTVNRGDLSTAKMSVDVVESAPRRKPAIPQEARGKVRRKCQDDSEITVAESVVTSEYTPAPKPWATPPAGFVPRGRGPPPKLGPAPSRAVSGMGPVFQTGNSGTAVFEVPLEKDSVHHSAVFETQSAASFCSPAVSPRHMLSDGGPETPWSLTLPEGSEVTPADITSKASTQASASTPLMNGKDGPQGVTANAPVKDVSGSSRENRGPKGRRASMRTTSQPTTPRGKRHDEELALEGKKASYAQLHGNRRMSAQVDRSPRMSPQLQAKRRASAIPLSSGRSTGKPAGKKSARRPSSPPPTPSAAGHVPSMASRVREEMKSDIPHVETFVSGSPRSVADDGKADWYQSPRASESRPASPLKVCPDKLESPRQEDVEEASPHVPQLMPRQRTAPLGGYHAPGPPQGPYTPGYSAPPPITGAGAVYLPPSPVGHVVIDLASPHPASPAAGLDPVAAAWGRRPRESPVPPTYPAGGSPPSATHLPPPYLALPPGGAPLAEVPSPGTAPDGPREATLAEDDVILMADLESVRRKWAHKTSAPIGSPTSVLDLYLGERELGDDPSRPGVHPSDPIILSPSRSPGLFIADMTPVRQGAEPPRSHYLHPDATLLQLFQASDHHRTADAVHPRRTAPPPPP